MSLEVDGETIPDARWFYPAPRAAAAEIKDHFAFWPGSSIPEGRSFLSCGGAVAGH